MTTEYHKIETPYKRDVNGTKKLIEGEFRSPYVEYIKDCEWIWKEKVDGTNIRIIWDGYNVTVRGRTDNANLPCDLVKKLHDLFQTPESEELFEQLFGSKMVVLYGEGYGAGIQTVGKEYLDHKDFILFDVCVDGFFLDVDNGWKISRAFGIKYTPLLLKGSIEDAVRFVKTHPKSWVAEVNPDLVIEGVVGTPKVAMKDNNGKRIITKVKVEDFVNDVQ